MPDGHDTPTTFTLGEARLLSRPDERRALNMPPHHLLTHGVVVGMTERVTLCIPSSSD